MKKVMALALVLMCSGALIAQRGDYRQRNPQEMAKMQSERMKETLDLSDQQFASVQNINLKFAERMSQLRGDSTMSREDRQQKMSDLRNEHKSEIDAVLSPDQQAKRDAQRKNFDERRRGKRGESARLNGGAATSSLGLTDEQSKKMTSADESFRNKLQAIRNEKLTADERKDKVSSARDEHEKNVKSILSDEQFSKWKANMKNRSHKRLKQEHYYRK